MSILNHNIIDSYRQVQLTCPMCKLTSEISPPFNLIEFRCPVCQHKQHPFVTVDNKPIDLAMIREIVASMYSRKGIAAFILNSCIRTESARREGELLIDIRFLVLHALAIHWDEYLVRSTSKVAVALSIFPPLAFYIDSNIRIAQGRYLRAKWMHYLETWLSRSNFDPSRFPLQEIFDSNMLDELSKRVDCGRWHIGGVYFDEDGGLWSAGFGRQYNSTTLHVPLTPNNDESPVIADPSKIEDQIVSTFKQITSDNCDGNLFTDEVFIAKRQNIDDYFADEVSTGTGYSGMDLIGRLRVFTFLDRTHGDTFVTLLSVQQVGPYLSVAWRTGVRRYFGQGIRTPGGKHFIPDREYIDYKVLSDRKNGARAILFEHFWPSVFFAVASVIYTFFLLFFTAPWLPKVSTVSESMPPIPQLLGISGVFYWIYGYIKALVAVLSVSTDWLMSVAVFSSVAASMVFLLYWRPKVVARPTDLEWLPTQFARLSPKTDDGQDMSNTEATLWESLHSTHKTKLLHGIVGIFGQFIYAPNTLQDNEWKVRCSNFISTRDRTLHDVVVNVCSSIGLDMSEYKKQHSVVIINEGILADKIEGHVNMTSSNNQATSRKEFKQPGGVIARVFDYKAR